MNDEPLQIPAGTSVVEQIVRRSRFIGAIARARDRAEAMTFIQGVRQEYPDATHHCFAFIAGDPGNTGDVGMSDDGEPHGTAGKPMLSILTHSGIGEIVAVVTRYFGGVKLGTGGLVRAYSGCLQAALAELPLTEKIEYTVVRLSLPYACEDAVRRLLHDAGMALGQVAYSDCVTITLSVPDLRLAELTQRLNDTTNGQVELACYC